MLYVLAATGEWLLKNDNQVPQLVRKHKLRQVEASVLVYSVEGPTDVSAILDRCFLGPLPTSTSPPPPSPSAEDSSSEYSFSDVSSEPVPLDSGSDFSSTTGDSTGDDTASQSDTTTYALSPLYHVECVKRRECIAEACPLCASTFDTRAEQKAHNKKCGILQEPGRTDTAPICAAIQLSRDIFKAWQWLVYAMQSSLSGR